MVDSVNIDEALKKFSVGDGLTDGELSALIAFFDKLDGSLGKLTRHYNAGFGLARGAVLMGLQRLESFQHARNRDK